MSLINILPLFPKFPSSYWSYTGALELLKKSATMPPLGLITVLPMLPERYFRIQKVADLNISPLRDEDIKKSDIVMASAMIVQKESLEEIASRVHFFGKKLVVGGSFPTSYSDEVGKYADHLILGEVENGSLDSFVRDLLNGEAKKTYFGEEKPSLINTPIPRWDLLDINQYTSMAIQYSRGCPFDCEFCDITKLFGRKPRVKTPQQMVREFDSLYKAGWKGPVFIVDDNFIGNVNELRQMLPEITEWQRKNGYPFTLTTESSINLANDYNEDILRMMIKAGFQKVFIGLETNNPVALKEMNKLQNLGEISLERKIEIIQRGGLEVMGGFIIGFDSDDANVGRNMYNFIQEAGIPTAMTGLLTALKGTKLYTRLKGEGRLLEESNGNNTHNLGFNFKTRYDEKELINNYIELLSQLYLDSRNYWDRVKTLESRRGAYKRSTGVIENGYRAARILLYESVFVRPDFEFFKYLAKTAATHPSRVPEVIGRAAELRHFRIMTENMLKESNKN